MTATIQEKQLYGNDVKVLQRTELYTKYKLTDKTGEGIMTAYDVFPGIRLIYNDIHMKNCSVDAQPMENFMEINHCREGQIELQLEGGEYLYMNKGDLSINLKDAICNSSCFPLSHYHGISVEIDMSKAARCLSCILEDVSIDFEKLIQTLQRNEKCIIMRNVPSFDHIFSELYSISDDMRVGYYKIKVLEILFFLCGMDIDSVRSVKKYYSKYQVETVKAIKEYLDSNYEKHVTLDGLSKKFSIPLTSMKKCFQGMFETGIYAYLRKLRMQKAAVLLVETDETVLSIAGQVGYDNASKFSAAFRSVIGQLPTDYRRNCVSETLADHSDCVQMEHKRTF